MSDLSKLSDAELEALSRGDMSGLSDASLRALIGAETPALPATEPAKAVDPLIATDPEGAAFESMVRGRGTAPAAAVMRYGAPLLQPQGGPGGSAASATGEKLAQFIEGSDDPSAVTRAAITGFPALGGARGVWAGLKEALKMGGAGLAAEQIGTLQKNAQATGEIKPAGLTESGMATAIPAILSMLGRSAGRGLGAVTNNVAPEELARVQAAMKNNRKEDATLAAMQARGFKVRPSDVRPSLRNDLNEMIAGKTNVDNAVSRANESLVDDAARRAANLSPDSVIDEKALLAARENKIYVPYQQAEQLGLGGPLKNWQKQTDLLRAYNSGATTVEERIAKKLVEADEAKAFAELQKAATDAGRPDLAASLEKARVETAQNFSVEAAHNVGNGHVDARVFKSQLERNGEAGIHPELADIARFAAAFPEAVKPTAGLSTASSALTGGTVALGAAQGLAAGNAAPVVAAASIPAWRRSAVEKLLSTEYQAKNAVRDYTPKTSADPVLTAIIQRIMLQEEAARNRQ